MLMFSEYYCIILYLNEAYKFKDNIVFFINYELKVINTTSTLENLCEEKREVSTTFHKWNVYEYFNCLKMKYTITCIYIYISICTYTCTYFVLLPI